MANTDHIDSLRRGVKAWNAHRKASAVTLPDFSGADLAGLDLVEELGKGARNRCSCLDALRDEE
jgi:hypothetical protein